ncbi:MAG: glycoside hydrolase family 3 N-terminal domain-containing protein [Acidobacteriota bacterium]
MSSALRHLPSGVRAGCIVLLSIILASYAMTAQTKASSAKSASRSDSWVKKTLRQLTISEKVGQLIMPAFRGVYLNDSSPEFRELAGDLQKYQVGGLILFAGDVYESALLIEKLQKMSKMPLFIASDFERGASFRIRNTVSLPWNMAIGATGDEHFAYLQGQITAREARALGVNWVFAPVLDVNNNPANPVINIRSYGEDPELVARMGAAFVRGAQEGGVMATGKHFPGHGDTATDSHLELPVVSASRARLGALEWVPFRRAIEAGVQAIMTAHLAVPALEGDAELPATLSERIMKGVLREELGFNNLIVTDSFKMAGLSDGYWIGDAAVRALQAGADIILDPPDVGVVHQALLSALQNGRLSEERINRSVERILRAKAWLGLSQKQKRAVAISREVADPEWQRQAQQMAEAGITLVRDVKQWIPQDLRRVRSVHALMILSRDQQEDTAAFQEALRERVDSVRFDRISITSQDEDWSRTLREVRGADLVVCAAFARVVTGSGQVGLPERLAGWMQELSELQNPVVAVALGNPYIIQQVPQLPAFLCTFSNADVSQVAAVKALFGEIPIRGKLPVTIPDVAPVRAGETREGLNQRLVLVPTADLQPVVEPLRALDGIIEEQIRERVFPGAVVAVGYRSQLVYHKPFGRLDYSSAGKPVSKTTVYDLASLTKVLAATPVAMHFLEKGELKLEYPLTRYYPDFHGQNRDKITVRHLLTHSAGFPAHLPFYKDIKGKSAFVKKILQTPLEYEPGSKAVYSDLGIILLGDILEKIGGDSLDHLARRIVFEPLGMSRTLFNPPRNLRPETAPTENDPWRGRLIRGEVHDENAYAMGGVSAHAGLFGTSGDLAVFCQMLLNGGIYDHKRIVKAGTIRRFTMRQDFPPGSSRALGWDTPSANSSAGDLFSGESFGHTGFTGTSIWIDPTRELFVVLLTNRVHPTRENNRIQQARRLVADTVVKAIEGRL